VHNKNNPYITPYHTSINTSRVLSECDAQSSIYDNDADIKSVKKNFDRRTSQRFEEYEERMKEKRQKRKDERDKNIEQIIEKDKMDKSLTEKIEKGCLRCGCGLGGGVLPVWGLVSGLWYGTWLQYLSGKALPAGIEAGLKEGLKQIVRIVEKTRSVSVPQGIVEEMLSSGKFTNGVNLYDMVQYISSNMYEKLKDEYFSFWSPLNGMVIDEGLVMFNAKNSTQVAAVANAFEDGKAAEFAAHTSSLSNTIIASVVTILVIVLVMIIIYLILRYRRKKKWRKKPNTQNY
ncbi:rifin, partial [Plasmodium reichenowi]